MSELQELGKVTSVFFGIEDHGILTMMISINFCRTGQGFGGYTLCEYNKDKKRRVGCAAGTDFVLKILELFAVKELHEIEGKVIYAIRNEPYGTIVGLKTPPFEGSREFLVKDWQQEWFPKDCK